VASVGAVVSAVVSATAAAGGGWGTRPMLIEPMAGFGATVGAALGATGRVRGRGTACTVAAGS
jgi:hypothetical protein